MPKEGEKKTVKCPECEADCELVWNEEENRWEGRCGNCKLNVGRVYEHERYVAASENLRRKREEGAKKNRKEKEKESDPWSL